VGDWVPSRSVIAVRPEGEVRVYKAGEKIEVGEVRKVYGPGSPRWWRR
jgi:hypothetical protein